MAFGLGTLRLSPDAFWRATPVEIAAAAWGLFGAGSPPPMRRAELARLMARFPDEERRDGG